MRRRSWLGLLGSLVGGPLVACALIRGRRRPRLSVPGGVGGGALAIALLGTLAVWQWSPAIRDVRKAYEDPSTRAAYYTPLIQTLARFDPSRARVEVPFMRSHWEAAEVASRFPLARVWERQADIGRNGLFYDGVFNSVTYATWLTERGVSFVALPDAKPDYSSYAERGLIESCRDDGRSASEALRGLIEAGLPYLKLVWRSRDWRLYRVTLPHPMVVARDGAAMTLRRLTVDHVTLDIRRPGTATVRVEWSPYWRVANGCVERDGEWTRVIARRAGALRMRMSFTLDRVVSHGRRCG